LVDLSDFLVSRYRLLFNFIVILALAASSGESKEGGLREDEDLAAGGLRDEDLAEAGGLCEEDFLAKAGGLCEEDFLAGLREEEDLAKALREEDFLAGLREDEDDEEDEEDEDLADFADLADLADFADLADLADLALAGELACAGELCEDDDLDEDEEPVTILKNSRRWKTSKESNSMSLSSGIQLLSLAYVIPFCKVSSERPKFPISVAVILLKYLNSKVSGFEESLYWFFPFSNVSPKLLSAI
jgi:hypothetical protein